MRCQHAAALLLAAFAAVVAVASAAGVTHGDIMLYNYVGFGDGQPVEFRSPKGALKLKFDAQKYRIEYTSGAAVSKDGRYAVVLGQTAAQVWSGSPVAVFIQLGAKTKVLGVRALPGQAETKGYGCNGYGSAAALRSSRGSKGGIGLTVYQFMTCCCSTNKPSTQFVGQWSVPVSTAGKLGAMRAGPRVPYKFSQYFFRAAAIALVNGRVYVSVSLLPIADRDVPPHGVNIYELVTSVRKAGAGKRLVASLKFKYFTKVAVGLNWTYTGPRGPPRVFKHLPTSAVSGFVVSNARAVDKVYYAVKGKRTLVGGLPSTVNYLGFTALGSTAYALIDQGKAGVGGNPALDDSTYIYKVSVAELKVKAKGRVLFKVPQSSSYADIAVVP